MRWPLLKRPTHHKGRERSFCVYLITRTDKTRSYSHEGELHPPGIHTNIPHSAWGGGRCRAKALQWTERCRAKPDRDLSDGTNGHSVSILSHCGHLLQ